MCVLAFAYKMPGLGQLVLLGNRDEQYARPTEALDFWPDRPDVLGGRDLQAGGSWMAIRNNGRFAAVTHIREGFATTGERSRGELVSQFVLGDEPALDFAARLPDVRQHYAPFNLLFGSTDDLYHFHSRTGQLTRVTPGLHTLSNASLDTAWFKTERLADHLRGLRAAPREEEAFAWLEDPQQAPPGRMPNTGIGSALERVLSSIFIVGRDYGTRASTLLVVSSRGDIAVSERSFGLAGKETGRRRYTLRPGPQPAGTR
ncbi:MULTISPECIES: NRDE family protein [unclassified Paludibacterium]|uniref:NRDE family protein n=1 Tax=unclassified Paludibacterium TaxID=2618429 RepID=UPI001C057834|nr:NRDE family protein [Paludibacterium sp. B53371]BEV72488.1 NRDE family protein [Paludibacterium sp. THUN1379]